MKSIRMLLFFPLALIRLIFVLLISSVLAFTGLGYMKMSGFSRRLQKNILQVWGKSMMAVCGIKVNHNQLRGHQHFILMSNHRSYLDIAVLAAYLPASFVAKSEVKAWPLMKAAARLTNIIFVSRSEIKSMVSAMKQIKTSVNQGIPVAIFPEGTTFRGPLTKPFKKGGFKIAVETGIAVIPAAIHFEDEDDAWIDNDTFLGHFIRQMGKPVTKVHLRFGKPITGSEVINLSEMTKLEIDSMLQSIINEKRENKKPRSRKFF